MQQFHKSLKKDFLRPQVIEETFFISFQKLERPNLILCVIAFSRQTVILPIVKLHYITVSCKNVTGKKCGNMSETKRLTCLWLLKSPGIKTNTTEFESLKVC